MEIKVEKMTTKYLLDEACSFTANKEVHPNLLKMYRAEHSVIRTQLFLVRMYDIKTFVSVHLVRHTQGISHFVKSNREDRPGHTGDLGRDQPVNHLMFLNAQSLINLARKRLCNKAHKETIEVMKRIVEEVRKVDQDLAVCMVPDCIYRGKCNEPVSCGGYSK